MPNRVLVGVCVALVLFSARPAWSTTIWAGVFGDPSVVPDESYAYLDANEACVANVRIPPDQPCNINFRNVRSFNGVQGAGGCVIDSTCSCSVCGTSQFPNGGQTVTGVTGWSAISRTLGACPAGLTEYLGKCSFDPPKSKGPCSDCNVQWSNPVYLASGNKHQTETVYRAASGGLELDLTYNSQPGASYFASGPFGRGWSSPYFVRVRATGQGIAALQRPGGKELEFRQPATGHLYLADADVNERLERVPTADGTSVLRWLLTSPDGDRVEEHDGAWSFLRGHAGTLLRIRDRSLTERLTMAYSTASTPLSIAPRPNLLIAVHDKFGRQLGFTYDANNRVVSMTDSGGGTYEFQYDGSSGPPNANNLTRITFPDGKTRVYFYAETAHINGGAACSSPSPILPNALTGLEDENGIRFATWTWDCVGRVVGSQHAGVEQYTFNYAPGFRSVVDPLGVERPVGIQRTLGIAYSTGITQPAASGSGTVTNSFTRDAQGNLSSKTDYIGNRTNYSYDLARNLEISRTEGLTTSGGTTPQTRTISTQWHPTFRLPTVIAEPLRITTFVYDTDGTLCGARGALCSKIVQATTDANGSQGLAATPTGSPRTWTYIYNANSDVLSVNGPRTDAADVTTYTYYAENDADRGRRGNVATITNALGHTTDITEYNAHGQPLTMVDPNGLTTTMTYDARQRLKTRTVGGERTTYDYDFAGQLTKLTLPDGSFLSYSYDDAHRLTGMHDNVGNHVAYTLDSMGNRTQEQVFDPANQLAQTRSRVFNSLNRLFRELGAQSQTTEYVYDDQGNVLSVKDPLNRLTSNQYDALNRLRQVTSPAPISAVTQYAYNGLDALVQVTDPRNLVTGYAVDGLGNLNVQMSPDTGTTTNTYDAAGNLLTRTDAKGQLTTYVYDALNRVTLITFHDGSKQTYAYDQGANGIERLSSIIETNADNQTTSIIAYAYDQHGRMTSETRSVGGTQYVLAYRYDSAGRLDQLTYPSGRTVNYTLDGLGRVNAITSTKPGEQPQNVVSNVGYHPFGGVKGYTLGNGQLYNRGIDLDGRIASYTLGAQSFAIGYDVASRISFISEVTNPANTNAYDYDALDRLISASLPTAPYAYSYDAVGNRTSRIAGSSTHTYDYSATSNRITSITPSSGPVRNFSFDPNGSTVSDGLHTYTYDVRGRMVGATSSLGATSYQLDALGQRIRKTNSLGDAVFHYDGQGRLIAETSASGAVKRELIYLGDIPVGVVQ